MPLGDRTGPMGMGPMKGRAAGYCAGYGVPGYANPVPGRGNYLGRGGRYSGYFGRGRGYRWRNWFCATGLPGWARAAYGQPVLGGRGANPPRWPAWTGPLAYPPYGAGYSGPDKEQELRILKDQADFFAENLEGIKKRIEELEAKSQTSEANE